MSDSLPSAPVVGDLEGHRCAGGIREPDLEGARLRVPSDVGQPLLGGAQQDHLGVGRQHRRLALHHETALQARLGFLHRIVDTLLLTA